MLHSNASFSKKVEEDQFQGTYTKHGPGSMDHPMDLVHGPPHGPDPWTRSMDPVHGPPHGTPLIFKRKSPLLI